MRNLNRHQELAQRLIGIIRGDASATHDARRNAIMTTLSDMAEHLSNLSLPTRENWSGCAAITAEAQQEVVNQGRHEPALRRAELLSTIRNIRHHAEVGEHAPDSLKLKHLLDIWCNQAEALSEVADTTTSPLSGSHHDFPMLLTPLTALDNVGLYDQADGLFPAPMHFELKYKWLSSLERERATQIGEAVEQMVATNSTTQNRSEIRVAIDAATGESITIRHSTDAPETLQVSAHNRCPFRVPAPSFTEDLNTQEYGDQVWHFAQNQPLSHSAITQKLDNLDNQQRQLEMTDVHALIDSSDARSTYKQTRDNILGETVGLARSLNPYSSQDRSATLMWSNLMARLGARADLPVTFATDKTDHTIPQAMVPSTAYALAHDEQGGCQCTIYRNDEHLADSPGQRLDPTTFQDAHGAFDPDKFADTMRSMGISSIRGPITAWRDEPEHSPEQAPVHLVNGRGLETIGQCVWGDKTDGTRLTAHQATEISQQRGPYNAFKFDSEADDQLGTMYFAQALGMREAINWNDLSIAHERAGDMEIEGTPTARLDLYFPGHEYGTFSDESALGTAITPLDLVHHDHGNLRHRIAVAAATTDSIDSETRHDVVSAIKDTSPMTLDAYIDAAHSERFEHNQNQPVGP